MNYWQKSCWSILSEMVYHVLCTNVINNLGLTTPIQKNNPLKQLIYDN